MSHRLRRSSMRHSSDTAFWKNDLESYENVASFKVKVSLYGWPAKNEFELVILGE